VGKFHFHMFPTFNIQHILLANYKLPESNNDWFDFVIIVNRVFPVQNATDNPWN